MAKKNRLELGQIEKDLLNFSAGDLIPLLEEKTKLHQAKQKAFEYYLKNTKEFVQVQVIVTRYKNDFLDDFVTEEMSGCGE